MNAAGLVIIMKVVRTYKIILFRRNYLCAYQGTNSYLITLHRPLNNKGR